MTTLNANAWQISWKVGQVLTSRHGCVVTGLEVWHRVARQGQENVSSIA